MVKKIDVNIKEKPATWLVVMAFAAIYIIWGTTYVAIVIGIKTLPPFIMAAIRYIIAAVVLLIICKIRGEVIIVKDAVQKMLLGAVILTGGQASLFWAEKYIESGFTAIIVSTLPLWYVLLDRRLWGSYFKNKYIITGLILGFIGIIILFRQHASISTDGNSIMQFWGLVSILGACVFWVIGTLYYKNHENSDSLFLNLGWQLMGGCLSSLLVGFVCGELNGFSFVNVSSESWLAVIFLAVAGSLVAFIAFNWLMTVKPAAIVGTYAYVNPVIAVILGWLIADETITGLQVIGMAIVLTSAFMVNVNKN